MGPKIYTADMTSGRAEIVRANPWRILARVLPDAVIVDRSAAEGGRISEGMLFVAAETTRKRVSLPGLEIRIRAGAAVDAPIADSVWPEGLRMASAARTLLDNLAPSRGRKGRVPRTLSRAELEDWLAAKAIAWGPERTERLRAECHVLAATFPGEHDLEIVDALFDQLQGLEPPRRDAGEMFKAFTAGAAWDDRRIALFETAIGALAVLPSAAPRLLPGTEGLGELPFYESYFSNYIEGTEFTVEEARTIIETQIPPADRPEDGHDILGTYHCVVDPVGRAATSTDADELIGYLQARHQTILAGRPDKNPGAWKSKPNQVGVYQFVAPELVDGTLRKGLSGLKRLDPGIARALYVMLVVSEVHPFTDGNGRVARVMMNAELSAVGDARIVIPSVYRNEYISALRRVSTSNGNIDAYLAVMTHAWRWTAAMPWTDRAATEGQLDATNALMGSTDAQNTNVRLTLP
ncbi:MAG: cell filamentation protein Fic [bacterium]|nr:cell filamentation protein Fic [bacterium]